MKTIIKYIEHKTAEHTDSGEAWIARVWISSSGKTLYFNDMALKRCVGGDCNHFDLVSREAYWISGVKSRGSNRHWGGGGTVQIEQSLVEWYRKLVKGRAFCNLIVVPDFPKPDIAKFTALENLKS